MEDLDRDFCYCCFCDAKMGFITLQEFEQAHGHCDAEMCKAQCHICARQKEDDRRDDLAKEMSREARGIK